MWKQLFACLVLASVGSGLAAAQIVSRPPPEDRVIGGERANIEDWPGFAVLGIYSRGRGTFNHTCGATLISPHHALTAAHCVETIDPVLVSRCPIFKEEIRVNQVGFPLALAHGIDRAEAISTDRIVRVERITSHPDYGCQSSAPGTLLNDIAILHLARPVEGPFMPLSLSEHSDPIAGHLGVAGFGRTHAKSEAGRRLVTNSRSGYEVTTSSRYLLEVHVPRVHLPTCQDGHGDQSVFSVTEGHICAGYRDQPKDSCRGDSGGPLVAYDDAHRPFQVGIVSWGPSVCGTPGQPGVYSRLSYHADWIRSHVSDIDGYEPVVMADPTSLTSVGMDEIKRVLEDAPETLSLSICDGATHSPHCGLRRVRVGDWNRFRIEASEGGQLVLFAVNPEGKVNQLFPNTLGAVADGRLSKNVPILFPDPVTMGFAFSVQPPAGEGRLLAILAPPDAQLTRFAGASDVKTRGLNIGFWGDDQPVEGIDISSYDDFTAERYVTELAASLQAEIDRLDRGLDGWAVAELRFQVEN